MKVTARESGDRIWLPDRQFVYRRLKETGITNMSEPLTSPPPRDPFVVNQVSYGARANYMFSWIFRNRPDVFGVGEGFLCLSDPTTNEFMPEYNEVMEKRDVALTERDSAFRERGFEILRRMEAEAERLLEDRRRAQGEYPYDRN